MGQKRESGGDVTAGKKITNSEEVFVVVVVGTWRRRSPRPRHERLIGARARRSGPRR